MPEACNQPETILELSPLCAKMYSGARESEPPSCSPSIQCDVTTTLAAALSPSQCDTDKIEICVPLECDNEKDLIELAKQTAELTKFGLCSANAEESSDGVEIVVQDVEINCPKSRGSIPSNNSTASCDDNSGSPGLHASVVVMAGAVMTSVLGTIERQ